MECLARHGPGIYRAWSERKDEKVEEAQKEFAARDYQLEMLNVAKKENTIVMMPTGSGKTYVAVLLIKHFLNQVMTDPTKDPINWKRTFFLVNLKVLVDQQAKVLEQHTGVVVGRYSSRHSSAIDTWDKTTWFYEFKRKHILVMTSDIFLKILSMGVLHPEHVNVLVLDECHHAKENHPMAQIMRDYWKPKKPTARVLGLTASVIDKKKITGTHDLEVTINKLCDMLNARLVTPLEFSNQLKGVELPQPKVETYDNTGYGCEISVIVNNLVAALGELNINSLPEHEQSTFKQIKRIVNVLPKILTEIGGDCLREMIPELGAEISKHLDNSNIAPILNKDGELRECLTYKLGVAVLNQLQYLKLTAEHIVDSSREVRMSVKFYDLLKYLITLQCSSEQPPRIIIFIETRKVVIAMHKYVTKLRNQIASCANLKAAFVLGGTTGNSSEEWTEDLSDLDARELQEAKKRQDQAILDFREGKCNILIATSVVEEGLDIPACNVVIRYDFPPTYRAYVQSRGRARQKPSTFTFFVSESEYPERMKTLNSYNEIEQLLRKFARSHGPREAELDDDVFDYNTIIPPLQVQGSGAKVTAPAAIQRLNFYCSQLPKDDYTDVLPTAVTTQELDLFRTTLTLPKLCPVDGEVQGDPMSTKKLAKMSAAMKALRALYEAKELTDALLPQFRQKETNPLLIMSEDGRSVTVDQKLKIPSVMWRRDLKEESVFYVHSIDLSLEPTVDDFAEYFTKGKEHKVACFGILTKDRLPEFPVFKVYPRFGVVTVKIKFEREISVPVHVLPDYYWFQEAVFTHILEIHGAKLWSDALFKNYFVLPLCRKTKGSKFRSTTANSESYLDVDGRFIAQLKKQWVEKPGQWKFRNMPENLENCADCVIFPAYQYPDDHENSKIGGSLYVVLRTSEYTPQDVMKGRAGDDTKTYEEHHASKHNITLKNRTQNLLECRHVTRHYDFASSKKDASSKYSKSVMYMVGEIHKVHPMPASLWNQATCIPSVLWRLETLLLSKELTDSLYKDSQLPIELKRPDISHYFLDDVRNLKQMLRRDIEYRAAVDWLETLQAITHKSCKEGFNLERLEFLGDKFLKLTSTLFYYRTMPSKHEGWLSKFRSQLISNENLAIRSSRTIRLPRYIFNKLVNPKENWIPPCFISSQVSEKIKTSHEMIRASSELSEETTEDIKLQRQLQDAKSCCEVGDYLKTCDLNQEDSANALLKLCDDLIPDGHLQRLGTKDVADSMEALIGLALSRYGYRKGVDLLDLILITTFQSGEGQPPDLFNDYIYEPIPESQIKRQVGNDVWRASLNLWCQSLDHVQAKLSYTFKEPLYLLEALTHASFSQIDACYQRLEFLGDAVLDMLMVAHIYEHNPTYDQGEMTDLLASLVCNTTLSKVCTTLNLHKALLYDSVELYNDLARFYMNFDDDQLSRWCQDLSLERVFVDAVDLDTMDEIPIMDLASKVVQTPKILGDLVESIIGAIYLDSGEDMNQVWNVIWPWFQHFYDSYSSSPPKNPKALVNETYTGIKRDVVSYPGDQYKFIASITIATRDKDDKLNTYQFRTIGRDRETAMEVCYGRAWHFHKKYLSL